jgi:hypothetical protein
VISNSKAARINTGRRFLVTDQKIPGPGTYDSISGDVTKGDQVVSYYHTVLTPNLRSTGVQRPMLGTALKTPGPGTYRPPSDFGYVDMINGNRS